MTSQEMTEKVRRVVHRACDLASHGATPAECLTIELERAEMDEFLDVVKEVLAR